MDRDEFYKSYIGQMVNKYTEAMIENASQPDAVINGYPVYNAKRVRAAMNYNLQNTDITKGDVYYPMDMVLAFGGCRSEMIEGDPERRIFSTEIATKQYFKAYMPVDYGIWSWYKDLVKGMFDPYEEHFVFIGVNNDGKPYLEDFGLPMDGVHFSLANIHFECKSTLYKLQHSSDHIILASVNANHDNPLFDMYTNDGVFITREDAKLLIYYQYYTLKQQFDKFLREHKDVPNMPFLLGYYVMDMESSIEDSPYAALLPAMKEAGNNIAYHWPGLDVDAHKPVFNYALDCHQGAVDEYMGFIRQAYNIIKKA